jgi:predicted PurR-regulated permease PerM
MSMNRDLFSALLAFASLAFYLLLVYWVIAPFLRPLAWAAVIGIVTFPMYRRLHARLHRRDWLAATIMTPLVVLVLIIPVVGLVFFLTQEATGIYQTLAQAVLSGPFTLEHFENYPLVQSILKHVKPFLDKFDINVKQALKFVAGEVSGFLVDYSTAILKNLFTFGLKVFILLLVLFFIYKDGERFQQRLLSLVTLPGGHLSELVDSVENVLHAVIFGIFVTCFVQGVLGGIGYWLAGLPSPVLLGVMTAVSALVPVVGTALIWAPAALYLFFKAGILKGLFMLGWGTLVISTSDNLVRPFFISGRGHISFLVVILGLLGGLAAFGFIGIIVGPIILSLFLTVLEIYLKRTVPAKDAKEA